MQLPDLLYGTAWKEERTEPLVTLALKAGFRAFDTANQRKHYFEDGVGRALATWLSSGKGHRSDLFLQTKFTYQRGQDHRLPYDPNASVDEQVRQSFASSLVHLRSDYLDSYVLHGPETGSGLTANDRLVWRTMEQLQETGKTKSIGLSNVSAAQLQAFIEFAQIKPTFVQNRCYPSIGWDAATRALCRRHGVVYQGFNLIRDPLVTNSAGVAAVAHRHKRTVTQVVYRWAKQIGMWPMTGTTDETHMQEALAISTFELSPVEMEAF